MVKHKLLLVLILFANNIIYSQNQNNNWAFGYGCGISFSSGVPVILNNTILNQSEGSASISDVNGNLLFYTDGIDVISSNNNYMLNAYGLLGNSTTTQSAIIVPKPNDCNIYYVFTTAYSCQSIPLSYSIIDMSLNGGLGDLTQKNIPLYPTPTERLTATLDSNGVDYWVISQKGDSNTILSYHVTSSGVDSVPVISYLSSLTSQYCEPFGYMKVSPNGKKLCYVNKLNSSNTGATILLDYNNNTGIASNPIRLNDSINSQYGVEFSPDNSKLYISKVNNNKTIWQFNLLAGSDSAIQNSKTVVYESIQSSWIGALQLAPNGKIYFSNVGKNYLGVINQPNSLGLSCNIEDSTIVVCPNSNGCRLGLPNLIKTYSSYCNTSTDIINPNKDLPITFYPNPAKNYLHISNITTKTSIFIYDIFGKNILKKETENNLIIDVSGFKGGIYTLIIKTRHNILIDKLIIQK